MTTQLEQPHTQRTHRPELAIDVTGLVKRYGEVTAVDGVDLQVAHGEIFALLGPNGAGKTTTVEILEGHRRRTAGTAAVLGEDPAHAGADWRARVGVVSGGSCSSARRRSRRTSSGRSPSSGSTTGPLP